MTPPFDRREFLRTAAMAGVGITLGADRLDALTTRAAVAPNGPYTGLLADAPMKSVRMAMVGVGHQGSSHFRNFLKIEGAEIRAVCDLLPERVAAMQKLAVEAGKPEPKGYSGSPDAFRKMIDEVELDLVYTATPWEWHAPVMLAAMRAGRHAATEVPMAATLDELWELVETAEKTKRHCVMMENCNYDRTEMMVLNMVRKELFGELLNAECGYLHDLRTLKLTDYYVGRWRVNYSITRQGDNYPTHGLGPVAQWMNVTRGNNFDYLVSTGSKSRGLNLWAEEHIGPNSPEARQKYSLGDVVNTLIRTTGGQTILVKHNTSSPRPYSRKIELQGTKGIVRKYPEELIYLEGRSPKEDAWEALKAYQAQYEHPIWKALEEQSKGAGHGGMDYIEDYRLIQCLREGTPVDSDVYDGAAVSSVVMLSDQSVRQGSQPVKFPDFTRGGWKSRSPLGIVELPNS
jgi:predicted dehydrogenase